jgi:hypothetical protein
MNQPESRPTRGPSVESVKRWIELLSRREEKLLARLEKLVRPGRSLEWLHREWWRRKNLRHERRTISYLMAVQRNRQLREVRPDHILDSVAAHRNENGRKLLESSAPFGER